VVGVGVVGVGVVGVGVVGVGVVGVGVVGVGVVEWPLDGLLTASSAHRTTAVIDEAADRTARRLGPRPGFSVTTWVPSLWGARMRAFC